MKYRFLVLLLASVLALGASRSGFAYTDSEIEELVMGSISELHPKASAEWWRSLGAGASRVMMKLYEKSTRIYHRLRLTEALAFFADDPKVADFLKQQADSTPDDVIRHAVIRGIGATLGAKESDFLGKFLSHSDPDTRFEAAQALQKIDDPRAKTLLEKFRSEEKTPWILSRLNNELPKNPRPLQPSGSSEDRLNPALAGEWKGLWITPVSGNPTSGEGDGTGFRAEAANLSLVAENGSELKADLELKAGKSGLAKRISIPRIQARKNRVFGTLPAGALDPGVVAFEGELREEAGTMLLELRAPKLGATVVLRHRR